jgi:hypothetical protein
MRREDSGSVKIGQTVWVHEPNPPTYGLFEGEVTAKPYPDVLRIYIPQRDVNVSPDLARIHLNQPDAAERAQCHWCKGTRVAGVVDREK